MVIALLVGGAGLASTRGTPPVNDAMTAQVAQTVAELPPVARQAAARTVELTITTSGHVSSVAAMVLPHDLAVTTAQIAHGALLSASIPGHVHFHVTWIGRDSTLGFTIVRLGINVQPMTFAPLPADASVVAVSPIVTGSSTSPRFAWADTTLGDPTITGNGVVSYLSTKSNANLDGFTDAVAVNGAGHVVAVLSINHLWYSAQFVARVANIVATGDGCHSSLDIQGTNDQGGGVLVTWVSGKGPTTGHLRPGDDLTAVNGRDIDSWDTMLAVLYLTPAGTTAELTFVRGATTDRTEVILACAL